MAEAEARNGSTAPLLRERGRHTRWFALAMFALFAGGVPALSRIGIAADQNGVWGRESACQNFIFG